MTQGGYQAGKTGLSRALIQITLIDDARLRMQKWTLMIPIDSAMFFNTIRTTTLTSKMQQEGIPQKLERSNWNWKTQEVHRVDGFRKGTKKFRSVVGATQGSSWSPTKGVIYSTEIQRRVDRESVEMKLKTPKVTGIAVPQQMFADDSLLGASNQRAAQNLWDRVEDQSLQDGNNVVTKKCEFIVLHFQPGASETSNFDIISKQGTLKQSENRHARYIGFLVEYNSYLKHLQETSKNMIARSNFVQRCIQETNNKANLQTRKTLHEAKVRGTGKYGMKLWAGTSKRIERTHLDRNENQLLRKLTGCSRRPKCESMFWILKLKSVSTIALLQGFNMWRMTSCGPDPLEDATMKHWRMRAKKRQGWLLEIVCRIKKLHMSQYQWNADFDQMLDWKGENHVELKATCKRQLAVQEEQDLQEIPSRSRHAWILKIWPDMRGRRLWEMTTFARRSQQALTKFALCEHVLDVELGKMAGVDWHERRRKACWRQLGKDRVETETHVMGPCVRLHVERPIIRWKTVKILIEEHLITPELVKNMDADSADVQGFLPLLHQARAWTH